jgi:XTP/dITP diphosphohydrolase
MPAASDRIRSIVLATGNPHKVAELRAIFAPADVEVLGLGDLPAPDAGFAEPVEHGLTFAANARIKALDYARQTGRVCLGDDSGIEIDALALADGTPRPGVISSHYCSDGREEGMTRDQRDAANNARVLRELDGVPPERRAARFVCCMCLAGPDGVVHHQTRGACEGRIGVPPRVPAGRHGFGYDPLFLLGPRHEHTIAEMAPSDKNQISHRARAAMAMLDWLRGRSA